MADLNTRITKGNIIDGSSSYFTGSSNAARIITDDFFGVAAGGTAGYVNVWNGAAWVLKPVKVWTGSAWIIKPAKFWNGAAWVLA